MQTITKLALICLLSIQSTSIAQTEQEYWTIDIYPQGSPYNPVKITFSGKRYHQNKGIALNAIQEPDNAEQFIRYVIQVYNQASPNAIIALWHPDEQDHFEFLGKDKFHIKEFEQYKTGDALEVRLLSRIDYGNLHIFHIAATGLNRTKVIRYTIFTSDSANRYYLTTSLKKGGEYSLFESYTKHLNQTHNQPNTTRIKQ